MLIPTMLSICSFAPRPDFRKALGVLLSDLCMIGDRLYTDIALGVSAGIPSVLVLSGETRVEDLPESPHRPDFVFPHLGALSDYLRDDLSPRH